jgi:hypothetical protein
MKYLQVDDCPHFIPNEREYSTRSRSKTECDIVGQKVAPTWRTVPKTGAASLIRADDPFNTNEFLYS